MKSSFFKLGLYWLLLIASWEVKSIETRKTVKLENITINYHFKDTISLSKENEINELTNASFEVYTELFQGLPRDASGNTYKEISLHIRHGKYLGGEAEPKFIALTWNEETLFGYATWQTNLLHELFHLWSAESFRYQSGNEHWFNEGFTEYFTYKTAVKLGLITIDEALTIAVKAVGFYSSSKGLGNISMRKAGSSNKTKFDNYFLVYHGGWVAALVLDYDIRKRTNGTKCLDDLMRYMHTNYPRDKQLYSLQDISKGLIEIADFDYSGFLSAYVSGKAIIPVSEYIPLSDALWALTFHQHNKEYSTVYRTLGAAIEL